MPTCPAPPASPPPTRGCATFSRRQTAAPLLALHKGRLVMEHYAPGVTQETRLNSYSMIKSLVGALVLKAA